MVELSGEGIARSAYLRMGFAGTVADRIVFMDSGAIVDENDPENFFTNIGGIVP